MDARYHHTWRPHKPVNASPEQKNLGWKVVNAASVAVGAFVTQRLLTLAWRLVRHEPPPSGPADRRVTWGAALTWATSMAVGIAVSRWWPCAYRARSGRPPCTSRPQNHLLRPQGLSELRRPVRTFTPIPKVPA